MKQFESAPSNLKNLIILSLCQALFFSGRTLTFFAAALVAIAMLGEDLRFATAPVTAMLVGTSVATLPASFLMRAWGRRWGFTLGSLIGFSGALIAAQAVAMGNFAIFNFGIFLSGLYGGFAQQYRFAAAEVAPVPGRSRLKSKPIGVGACAPDEVITNDDLATLVDTADSWIKTRTGISRRHVMAPGEQFRTVAETAAQRAITNSGVDPLDVGLVIFATSCVHLRHAGLVPARH